MKLQNKIHLYSSVVFTCLLIVLHLSIYFLFSTMTIDEQKKRITAEAVKVSTEIKSTSDKQLQAELLRSYVPLDGMIRLLYQGQAQSASVTSSTAQQLSQLTLEFSPERSVEKVVVDQRSYILASIPVIIESGEVVNLQLAESIESTENVLAVLRMILLLVTLLALIPLLISSRWLGVLITRPITDLIRTMNEIERSGEFKQLQLNEKSKDELAEMGRTFNVMIDRLAVNFAKQERFVSDASHELRTPLTIIESYASLLKRRAKERPDLIEESVEAIHSEAVRMKELTEQLLLLARNPAQWQLEMEQVELAQVIEESSKTMQKVFERFISVEIHTAVTVNTDIKKLKQLLFIFIDNALKYSKDEIRIKLDADSKTACIRVIDRGIGISKENLSKVFDRFYRVDESRNRAAGGAGLGLSLAAELAAVLGVTIELNSTEDLGTTVSMLFNLDDGKTTRGGGENANAQKK